MMGELSMEEIDDLLRTQVLGRLGFEADGRVYVLPIRYVYDGESIFAHAAEGLKIRAMRANPNVCFEVDHVENLANWRSVLAWGRYEEIFHDQRERAMDLLVARHTPVGLDAATEALRKGEKAHLAEGVRRSVVFRIRLEEKTGRFQRR